jgi:hypothetical protein
MSDPVFVFIAVYNPTTGVIRQVNRVEQVVADKQHQAWEAHDFVEVPAGTNPKDHQIDLTSKQAVPRVTTPAEQAAEKTQQDRIGVMDKITGGFTSAALGTPREYPSGPVDQTNMLHAAQVGGKLWSALNGDWGFLPHTADQARQVLTDFVTMKDAHRDGLTD